MRLRNYNLKIIKNVLGDKYDEFFNEYKKVSVDVGLLDGRAIDKSIDKFISKEEFEKEYIWQEYLLKKKNKGY